MTPAEPLPPALAPLVDTPNWVIWRFESTSTGNQAKVPYRARSPNIKAKTDDPSSWAPYADAVAANGAADGLGFVLTETDIGAFDIDDCRDPDTGVLKPWAHQKIEAVASYAEITPSGTGVRIIGYSNGPPIHRKLKAPGVTCELYRRATRYITVTGNQVGAWPLVNIDEHIDATLAELDGARPSAQAVAAADDEDELERTIRDGGGQRHGPTRSENQWFAINEMMRRGYAPDAILKVLLDRTKPISEHTYAQASPADYAARQIAKAKRNIELYTNKNGKVAPTQNNIRIALFKLGVTVRYDLFADRTLIEGLPGFGPTLDDAAMIRLRLAIDRRFGLMSSKVRFCEVVGDAARLNGFHPVCDYLDALQWDGIERIDRWLTTYGGAEETSYTQAVGALLLTAAVRRVRRPGCKFDEMPVLESPQQGTDKSTALACLCGRAEWFSDDLPLNVEGKRVIEALQGKWIVEAAEMSGLKHTDVEPLKALLSRQVDRGRLAYGHLVSEVPRQCVIVGTTNSEEYLKDTTGNRRFWPVRVKRFDLDALTRDRDQLWAEAAARELTGVSIRLDRQLWPAAAQEQAQRVTNDPYFEELQSVLGQIEISAKIASTTVWDILDVRPGQRTQDQNRRMGEAMRALVGVGRTKQVS